MYLAIHLFSHLSIVDSNSVQYIHICCSPLYPSVLERALDNNVCTYGRSHSPCSPNKGSHFVHECVQVGLYALQGLNKHINIISGHHKWNISDYYFYYVFIVCILYYLYFGKRHFLYTFTIFMLKQFPEYKIDIYFQ